MVRGILMVGVVVVVGAMVGMLAGAAPARGSAGVVAGNGTVRVGTYDTRAVGLAYGRSKATARERKGLMAEHAKAKEAGDGARVKQLERKAELRQVRMHLQVFSNAPVTDAMDSVRDRLAGVAERMRVGVIVSAVEYKGADVEVVDVTDEVVKLFEPSEATLRLIAEGRAKKALPIEEVAQIPAKN